MGNYYDDMIYEHLKHFSYKDNFFMNRILQHRK